MTDKKRYSESKEYSRALALLFAFCSLSFFAMAEQEVDKPQQQQNEEAVVLPTVQVKGQAESGSSRSSASASEGAYYLNRSTLDQYGDSNGSMTDVLDTVPNVQFSDAVDDPASMSSLKPQSVSISGGRYYENNFSINGISNNSLIDPAGAGTSDSSISDVPGHEQALFFDLDQIGSITVYDSNVPAEYGRFTGGVVDAEIRRPGQDNKTRFSYFTTRSDWVNYRVIINDDDEENPLYQPPEEPEFERHRFTASHERGINAANSLRINFSGSQSVTPELSLRKTEQIEEESYNLTATHGYVHGDIAATSFISLLPYQKHTLLSDVKDSEYDLSGGGIIITTDMDLYAGGQEHTIAAALSHSVNSREAPQNFYNWANTNSRQWGLNAGLTSSRQGGYGNLDKYQALFSINWKTATLFYHPLFNRISYGVNFSHGLAGFDRPEDAHIYRTAIINTAVQCVNAYNDCVQNEQYFRERQIYPADKVDVNLTEIAGFTELDWQWQRLNAVFGLRLDYDDFLRNTNLAWRTRTSYPLLRDDRLTVSGGINRYYGGPLLTYKLREAAKPYYQEYRGTTQNVVNLWQHDTGTGSYRYDFQDVKTPYSDELVISLNSKVLGGVAVLKLLAREGRDEFSRETTAVQPDGYRYYRVTNDGYTHYRSVSLSWDKSDERISYGFHITWSETESSNDTYDDSVDAATSTSSIWYDGERRTLSEISQLRENYARPVVASLYLHMPVTRYLLATVKGRYKSSYTTIVRGSGTTYAGTIMVDGVNMAEYLDNYEDKKRPATFLVDTRLRWLPFGNPYLTLTTEINNLFNSRTHTVLDSDDDGIEIGRSFWLGIETEF